MDNIQGFSCLATYLLIYYTVWGKKFYWVSLIVGLEYNSGMENGMERRIYTVVANSWLALHNLGRTTYCICKATISQQSEQVGIAHMHASIPKHGTVDSSPSSNSYGSHNCKARVMVMNNNASINTILHTWGRCWRKEGDLLSESSQRGWYLVRIVPIYSSGIHFSLVVLDVFGKLFVHEFHKDPYLGLSHMHCA